MDRTKLCPLGKEVVLARLPLLAPNEQSFILLAILPRPALKPAANDLKINEAECRRKEKIRPVEHCDNVTKILLAWLLAPCLHGRMTERKYRKPVNANGWMRKLQVFAFGDSVPHFIGYCPFFWFTWLTLLLLPIILPAKLIIALFRGAGKIAGHGIELLPKPTLKVSRPSSSVLRLFDEEVSRVGYAKYRERDYPDGIFEEVWTWIDATPDWQNCVARLRVKDEARKIKAAKRAKSVQLLSKYGAPVAKAVLVVGGIAVPLFLLYELHRLIIHIQWFRVWGALMASLPYIGWILLAAAIMFAFGWLLALGMSALMARWNRCPKRPEKVSVLARIGSGILAGLEFAVETIESIYTSECPLIEWGDKDEPIQRR